MEPVSAVTGAWSIVKTAGEATKKLYEFAKSIKDREQRQKIEVILDELRHLKHQASLLEDENGELREKLRFKSDEYEFRTPFWYRKDDRSETPLCPKCFSKHTAAPVGRAANPEHPMCLVCATFFSVADPVLQSRIFHQTS